MVLVDFLVNIDVDDLEKAVDFYQAAFGLQVGRRFGTAGVEMLGGPAPIYLLVKAAGTASSNAPGSSAPGSSAEVQLRRYERHWTPVHLDFVVQDIASAVARARAAGARLEADISTAAWGKLALLADPFGHGFCLLQFVGRGYDEIAE